MCGRFSLDLPPDRLLEDFAWLDGELTNFLPRYNVSPTEQVVMVTEARQPSWARWGLIPWWSKKPGKPLIQARSETVAQKPAFRQSFAKKRCLVPASGFYEWEHQDGRKLPYHIQRQDGRGLVMAGLFDRWEGPDGPVLSCCILTTEANPDIAPLHHRMPVVLEPDQFEKWLHEGSQALLTSSPAAFRLYRVSTVVNKAGNDLPECVQPLA